LTNIECSYDVRAYSVVGYTYCCNVKNNPNIITEESAQINRISGTHKSLKSNDDVLGIHADSKTIQIFPKGLEKLLKNIKVININNCQLKEIHQSDLKVFPKLVYLYLVNNGIEVIEDGLFDLNHNLELVSFQEKKLVHIDPNVFDHLTKLSYFWFGSVPCVDQTISNSTEKVQEAIKVVKSNCSNSEFLSLENQIKNLEIESKTLNSVAFNKKLENFNKNFNNSKFSKFRPLNYKFQNLIETEGCSNCRQLIKIQSIETEMVGLEKNIENISESQNITVSSLNEVNSKIQAIKKSQMEFEKSLQEIKHSQSEIKETLGNMTNILTKILRSVY